MQRFLSVSPGAAGIPVTGRPSMLPMQRKIVSRRMTSSKCLTHESACLQNMTTLSAISSPLGRSDSKNNHPGLNTIPFLVGLAV